MDTILRGKVIGFTWTWTDGGLVMIDDTTVLERALKILVKWQVRLKKLFDA